MTGDPIRLIPIILYIGPDVLMPLASALAAIVGILLMFWRKTVGFFQRMGAAVGRLFRRRSP